MDHLVDERHGHLKAAEVLADPNSLRTNIPVPVVPVEISGRSDLYVYGPGT